jgi:type III secretion protein D
MDSAASRQLLKVLSGPHAGGEVLLADGDYVIGSDDASEIVLTDDYVAPRHARLLVRGNAVTCEALDGASIFLEGTGTDGAQLAAFQCFTLGNTHLAVGPAESKWPAVSLPNAPVAPPPIPVAARNEDEQPGDEDGLSSQSAQAPTPASTAPVAIGPAAKAPPKQPRNRGIWAAAAGLFVIAAAIVAFVLWQVFSAPPAVPVVSREVQQAALQSAIDKLGFGENVTVGDQHGRFVVTGHVPTPAAKRAVREAVIALDPATRLRVYDAETLLASVRDFLRMNGLEFTATTGKPGEVIIGGLLVDSAHWNRVKQRILTDMPQLETLTEDFANVPKVAIAPPVVEAPAVESLGVESDATEPDPEGPEAPVDAAPQTAVVATPVPEPTPPSPAEPPAGPGLPPIQSISVGNDRFITLTNGEHVFRGAVLESGYTVKEIERDRVVLARGASVYIIRIGI